MTYEEFLKSKEVKTIETGFEAVDINEKLFDWQRECVKFLVKKGKGALFADCGLGKTAMQLEWAWQVHKRTGRNILIVAPLSVSKQTKKEGIKFGYDVNICRSSAEVKDGINITNYEIIDKFDADDFVGVVLDESSILKSFMGVTKRNIMTKFKDTPYKLSATATPSPNDHMEILNQAEFLDVMRSCEALPIWFINDTKSSGKYRLKKHAVKDFWEWVSTWAICMSKPSDIGYSDEGYILPKLTENEIILPVNLFEEDGITYREIKTSATAFNQEKRYTAEDRAKKCAEIVSRDNEQYVVWCSTNYEADLLKEYIPEAVEVRGDNKPEIKEQRAIDFIEGKIRVLISKAKIFGYGLNFQNCRNCVFCGMDYSYENYYQAVRRFWRFGQEREVNVYKVLGKTELNILDTVNSKAQLHKEMHENMYCGAKNINDSSIKKKEFKLNKIGKINIPSWLKENA